MTTYERFKKDVRILEENGYVCYYSDEASSYLFIDKNGDEETYFKDYINYETCSTDYEQLIKDIEGFFSFIDFNVEVVVETLEELLQTYLIENEYQMNLFLNNSYFVGEDVNEDNSVAYGNAIIDTEECRYEIYAEHILKTGEIKSYYRQRIRKYY